MLILIDFKSAPDADINISSGLWLRGQEAGAGDWGHWPPLAHKTLRHQQPAHQHQQPAHTSGQYSVLTLLTLHIHTLRDA